MNDLLSSAKSLAAQAEILAAWNAAVKSLRLAYYSDWTPETPEALATYRENVEILRRAGMAEPDDTAVGR